MIIYLPGRTIAHAKPIHFDMVADDPKRAIQFYETVFGWKFQE